MELARAHSGECQSSQHEFDDRGDLLGYDFEGQRFAGELAVTNGFELGILLAPDVLRDCSALLNERGAYRSADIPTVAGILNVHAARPTAAHVRALERERE
jgi:hypothetical protein